MKKIFLYILIQGIFFQLHAEDALSLFNNPQESYSDFLKNSEGDICFSLINNYLQDDLWNITFCKKCDVWRRVTIKGRCAVCGIKIKADL